MKKKSLRVLAVCLSIFLFMGGCQNESTSDDQNDQKNNILPLAIKNLNAAGADRRVKAKWDSLDLVEEYEVEIRAGMGGIAKTIKTDISCAEINDLHNGTEYILRVRACLDGNVGAWSDVVSAVPEEPRIPPQAPGNLRLLAGDKMISGDFNLVESASEYAVLVDGVAHAVTYHPFFVLDNLENDREYAISVMARNSIGASPPCDTKTQSPNRYIRTMLFPSFDVFAGPQSEKAFPVFNHDILNSGNLIIMQYGSKSEVSVLVRETASEITKAENSRYGIGAALPLSNLLFAGRATAGFSKFRSENTKTHYSLISFDYRLGKASINTMVLDPSFLRSVLAEGFLDDLEKLNLKNLNPKQFYLKRGHAVRIAYVLGGDQKLYLTISADESETIQTSRANVNAGVGFLNLGVNIKTEHSSAATTSNWERRTEFWAETIGGDLFTAGNLSGAIAGHPQWVQSIKDNPSLARDIDNFGADVLFFYDIAQTLGLDEAAKGLKDELIAEGNRYLYDLDFEFPGSFFRTIEKVYSPGMGISNFRWEPIYQTDFDGNEIVVPVNHIVLVSGAGAGGYGNLRHYSTDIFGNRTSSNANYPGASGSSGGFFKLFLQTTTEVLDINMLIGAGGSGGASSTSTGTSAKHNAGQAGGDTWITINGSPRYTALGGQPAGYSRTTTGTFHHVAGGDVVFPSPLSDLLVSSPQKVQGGPSGNWSNPGRTLAIDGYTPQNQGGVGGSSGGSGGAGGNGEIRIISRYPRL
jgi:hypothetical protein